MWHQGAGRAQAAGPRRRRQARAAGTWRGLCAGRCCRWIGGGASSSRRTCACSAHPVHRSLAAPPPMPCAPEVQALRHALPPALWQLSGALPGLLRPHGRVRGCVSTPWLAAAPGRLRSRGLRPSPYQSPSASRRQSARAQRRASRASPDATYWPCTPHRHLGCRRRGRAAAAARSSALHAPRRH
jgi:hypothetical protein